MGHKEYNQRNGNTKRKGIQRRKPSYSRITTTPIDAMSQSYVLLKIVFFFYSL